MILYILIRKLSIYQDNDLILGIFDTKDKALDAKNKYILYTKYFDKYSPQVNFQINLNSDVQIIEKNIQYNYTPQRLYVILNIVSGMGQRWRNIVDIYDNTQSFSKGIKDNYDKYMNLRIYKEPFSPIEIEILNINQLRHHNDTKYPHQFISI